MPVKRAAFVTTDRAQLRLHRHAHRVAHLHHFPRLDAIRQQTGLPLVLHGGSGISDADFRRAIELGIHKINFYTGMSQAALAAVEQRMANRQPLYDEFAELLLGIEEAITDTVAEQMRIFGSAGQA